MLRTEITVRGLIRAGLAVFVSALIAEHLLEPGLSPLTHQVSEYARTGSGWVVDIGFAGWAVSLGAGALRCASRPAPGWSRWSVALALGVAAIGVVLLVLFQTQTSAGRLPVGETLHTGGQLHDIGSGVAKLGVFVAAVTVTFSRSASRPLRIVSAAAVAAAVVIDVSLLLAGSGVGGLRQRALIAVAIAWQWLVTTC